MIRKLIYTDSNFNNEMNKYLNQNSIKKNRVENKVKNILKDVLENGDKALVKYTKLYDNYDVNASGLILRKEEVNVAKDSCDIREIEALEMAAERISNYQKKLIPNDLNYVDETGTMLGCKWSSIDSCGIYTPGGKAVYPSSVLMNAIPARLANVDRIVMAVPTVAGYINPLVLVAAEICKIEEVYLVGGAQAIGGLAFGTESIEKVDKIVGPGNAYVAEAKKQVFGTVGIDSITGPSEILLVADRYNNPDWIALDLLSQAEHDEDAKTIFVTDNNEFGDLVETHIFKNLEYIKRKEIASVSIKNNGLIIIVPNMDVVPELVNSLAPEHLEILVSDETKLLKGVKNAGAIFIGANTPEAVGDYMAGPSHVLPTDRAARYSSGLSVLDFLKRTSIIKCNSEGINKMADAIITIAKAEGLDAHAKSVEVRKNKA